MFRNKIAFIIPTKNRRLELERLLKSFVSQERPPSQIIIVDGSTIPVQDMVDRFSLPITYFHVTAPRLTKQRNIGLSHLQSDITLVGLIDDDIEFKEHAIDEMLAYWEQVPPDVGGALFNITNQAPAASFPALNSLFSIRPPAIGRVYRSGFNTLITAVTETQYVQWLSGCATVWKREVFDEFRYDEWFEGYGLGEDLDFSFRVGKKYRLAIVSQARIAHHQTPTDRIGGVLLGKYQIINRHHIVSKDPYFSKPLFYLRGTELFFRNLLLGVIKINSAYILRAAGNIAGFMHLLFARPRPS